MRPIYEEQVRPHGPADMPGVMFHGHRVMAIGGSTLTMPDEKAHSDFYGYLSGGYGDAAFPVIRFVGMTECDTLNWSPFNGRHEARRALSVVKKITLTMGRSGVTKLVKPLPNLSPLTPMPQATAGLLTRRRARTTNSSPPPTPISG